MKNTNTFLKMNPTNKKIVPRKSQVTKKPSKVVTKQEKQDDDIIDMYLFTYNKTRYWTPDLLNGFLHSSIIDEDGDPSSSDEIVGKLLNGVPELYGSD